MQRLANERAIVQLALLIAAVALYASTFSQSFTDSDLAQSPNFFPRIILALWIGLSVIALIQTIVSKEMDLPIASCARIAVVIGAALVYTNVIGSEGFFLPSVVFAHVYLPAFGIRNLLLVVLFAILVAVAIVLPFTLTMGQAPAIILLLAVYAGSVYGGSIAAILINTPGTPQSAATCLDGYPMAQRGEAGLALGWATIASVVGGLVSALVLIFAAPQRAALALEFGPIETFALILLGMTGSCRLVTGAFAGPRAVFAETMGIGRGAFSASEIAPLEASY